MVKIPFYEFTHTWLITTHTLGERYGLLVYPIFGGSTPETIYCVSGKKWKILDISFRTPCAETYLRGCCKNVGLASKTSVIS